MRLSRKARRDLLWIVLILAGLGAASYLAFGPSGYSSLSQELTERDRLLRDNRELQNEANRYSKEIEDIKADPQKVERVLRENDYARPDEVIVTVPAEAKPPGSDSRAPSPDSQLP